MQMEKLLSSQVIIKSLRSCTECTKKLRKLKRSFKHIILLTLFGCNKGSELKNINHNVYYECAERVYKHKDLFDGKRTLGECSFIDASYQTIVEKEKDSNLDFIKSTEIDFEGVLIFNNYLVYELAFYNKSFNNGFNHYLFIPFSDSTISLNKRVNLDKSSLNEAYPCAEEFLTSKNIKTIKLLDEKVLYVIEESIALFAD